MKERQIKDRLTRTVSGIKERTVGVADGVYGRHHPAADRDGVAEVLKERAVIGGFQIGFFIGRIVKVDLN